MRRMGKTEVCFLKAAGGHRKRCSTEDRPIREELGIRHSNAVIKS
jgi:hypothetical protein